MSEEDYGERIEDLKDLSQHDLNLLTAHTVQGLKRWTSKLEARMDKNEEDVKKKDEANDKRFSKLEHLQSYVTGFAAAVSLAIGYKAGKS